MINSNEIRNLLVSGNAESIEEGIREIDEQFRGKCCLVVRRLVPGIAPQLVAEKWVETLSEIWANASNKKISKSETNCISSYAITILKRKTWQVFLASKKDQPVATELLEERMSQEAQTSWEGLSTLEQEELFESIRQFIQSLPPGQRKAIELLVEHYPIGIGELQNLIQVQTGKMVTYKSIESCVARARKKIKKFLSDSDYRELVRHE